MSFGVRNFTSGRSQHLCRTMTKSCFQKFWCRLILFGLRFWSYRPAVKTPPRSHHSYGLRKDARISEAVDRRAGYLSEANHSHLEVACYFICNDLSKSCTHFSTGPWLLDSLLGYYSLSQASKALSNPLSFNHGILIFHRGEAGRQQ